MFLTTFLRTRLRCETKNKKKQLHFFIYDTKQPVATRLNTTAITAQHSTHELLVQTRTKVTDQLFLSTFEDTTLLYHTLANFTEETAYIVQLEVIIRRRNIPSLTSSSKILVTSFHTRQHGTAELL